jgi:hypothetical protein
MRNIKSLRIFYPVFVPIYLGLGFCLWLLLGSITEFLLPLDSFKKISGIVSEVEHKTFEYRVSRFYITECKRTIIRLKENESRFVVAGLPQG